MTVVEFGGTLVDVRAGDAVALIAFLAFADPACSSGFGAGGIVLHTMGIRGRRPRVKMRVWGAGGCAHDGHIQVERMLVLSRRGRADTLRQNA